MNYLSLDLNVLRNNSSNGPRKVPFAHQSEALTELNRAFDFTDSKGKGGLLVLPTGAGKTFTAVKWLTEHAIPKGVKILWLAHSFHLLDQAFETLHDNAKSIPHSKEFLNIRLVSSNPSHCRPGEILPTDDVVIMTTPTAIGQMFREAVDGSGEKLESPFVKYLRGIKEQRLVLVLDEAHHAPAHGCRKLLCAIREMHPSSFFLGLTATPDYSDETRRGWLNHLFDGWILYQADKNKLQGQNILARERMIQKRTNVEFEVDDSLYNRLMREHRDLPEEVVEKIANNSPRNDFIVQEYLANRNEYGKTIIFADRWFQCLYLKSKLASAGVRADAVYSHIDADPGSADARNRRTADDNHRILKSFRNDELDVLVNVRMLTEGTDVPNTRTVFITRDTTSRILMTQMIGRALRGEKAGGGPDKKEANLVFFTDTWRKVIHWASYSPGGGLSEEQAVRGYRPMEMISIRLVEKLIERVHSGKSYQAEPFDRLMPVGWYKTTYSVSTGDGDQMESFDEFVMVYNFQEAGYRAFIERNLGKLAEEWEKEDLSVDQALERVRLLAVGCFRVEEDDLGSTLLLDLVRVARHMAQKREPPEFFAFEERDQYDLDRIAAQYWTMNSRDQKIALEKLYQKPGACWQTFYRTFDRFKQAYDGALNRYLELMDTGADSSVKLPDAPVPLPPEARRRELSEREKEQIFIRDHQQCLCCGARRGKSVRLQIDHILPAAMGGETSVENSQTLCKYCNQEKGINELNFRIHRSPLKVPKQNLEIFKGPDNENFEPYTRRIVNFFYHCHAVVRCFRQKAGGPGEGKLLVLELYDGNNPEWLKPHANKLLKSLRDTFSGCGTLNNLIIESCNERVEEKGATLVEDVKGQSSDMGHTSELIDPSLEARADSGDVKAQVEVARILLQCTDPRNRKRAIRWLEIAAKQENAEARYELAECLRYGIGTLRKIRRARKLMLAAAEAGYAKAQFEVAGMFKLGEGGAKDYSEHLNWLRQAALQDHAESLYHLGLAYQQGDGVSVDFDQAMKYYQKAATAGSHVAMKSIGHLYECGHGVVEDFSQAVIWYRRAAAAGNPQACRALALMYAKGISLPKDPVQAYLIYSYGIEQVEFYDKGVISGARTRLARTMEEDELDRAYDKLNDPDFLKNMKAWLTETPPAASSAMQAC